MNQKYARRWVVVDTHKRQSEQGYFVVVYGGDDMGADRLAAEKHANSQDSYRALCVNIRRFAMLLLPSQEVILTGYDQQYRSQDVYAQCSQYAIDRGLPVGSWGIRYEAL